MDFHRFNTTLTTAMEQQTEVVRSRTDYPKEMASGAPNRPWTTDSQSRGVNFNV